MSNLSKSVFQAARIGVLTLAVGVWADHALSGVTDLQSPKEKVTSPAPCDAQAGKTVSDLCGFNV